MGACEVPSASRATPKSPTLTVPVRAQQDVGGLDVAVHHPLRVRARERATQLLGDGPRLGGHERPAQQALGQALALDQLGDVVGTLIRVADVEDLHDARVADAREQARLALEALHPRAVLGPPGLDHLHRHRSPRRLSRPR